MSSFGLLDLSFISKLPELLGTSTQSARKGWFGHSGVDAFVPTGAKAPAKGAKPISQRPLSRRMTAQFNSLQRQVMDFMPPMAKFKPAPSSPFWTVQKSVNSVCRNVKEQFHALPGYLERVTTPVKNWWQGFSMQEKPLPPIPKSEDALFASPDVFTAQSSKNSTGFLNAEAEPLSNTQPLRIDKNSTNIANGIKRKPPIPLNSPQSMVKAENPGFDGLFADIDQDIHTLQTEVPATSPEKMTGWNGQRKPLNRREQFPKDTGVPEKFSEPVDKSVSDAEDDPLFEALMRDIQTRPVVEKPYQPRTYHDDVPEEYQSRTLLDDMLADLRAGIYPPRGSRAASRQKPASLDSSGVSQGMETSGMETSEQTVIWNPKTKTDPHLE